MKLKQVAPRLNQMKTQIAFIQETHLLSSEYTPLKKRWQGQVISASFSFSHSLMQEGWQYLYTHLYHEFLLVKPKYFSHVQVFKII